MRKHAFSALCALMLLAPGVARAQSSPGFVYNQQPSPGQWNSYFAAKQDLLGPSNALGIAAGGTGSTTVAGVLTNLGIGVGGSLNTITLNGVTTLTGQLTATGQTALIGKLGVGTATPGELVDIVSTTTSAAVARATATNTASAAEFQGVADTASGTFSFMGSTTGGTTYGGLTGSSQAVLEADAASSFYIGTGGGAAPIVFAQNRVEKMRIDISGRLLIGATADNGSGDLLQVSGPPSFGTYTGTTCTNVGSILIHDAAGNARKLMVCS